MAPIAGLATTRKAWSTSGASRHAVIDNCQIVGSGKNGIALERVAGRVENTEISGAADAGIYSVEASGLQISGNSVSDCANGGILVHRWQPADDGTIVSGNRVTRIRARNGGTGQNGNGINVFRANNVMVSNNMVSDSAFSAIRANSASNIQISANSCIRSGETGIYAEFSFEGAIINANVVDGAANGISIVNFNEGGRMAVCSANIVRNLSPQGPYQQDPPGFGVGISVEADCSATGNVIENVPLYGMQIGWGEFMRNVVATGNVIRKAGTGIIIIGGRRHGVGGRLRQCDRRRQGRRHRRVSLGRARDRRSRGRRRRRPRQPHHRAQPGKLSGSSDQFRRWQTAATLRHGSSGQARG